MLAFLYTQRPGAISRLNLDQVHASRQHVRLQLGLEPIGPRRRHAALGNQGSSRWLFPGGQPRQPVSAYRLAERLRQLGLRPGPAGVRERRGADAGSAEPTGGRPAANRPDGAAAAAACAPPLADALDDKADECVHDGGHANSCGAGPAQSPRAVLLDGTAALAWACGF